MYLRCTFVVRSPIIKVGGGNDHGATNLRSSEDAPGNSPPNGLVVHALLLGGLSDAQIAFQRSVPSSACDIRRHPIVSAHSVNRYGFGRLPFPHTLRLSPRGCSAKYTVKYTTFA